MRFALSSVLFVASLMSVPTTSEGQMTKFQLPTTKTRFEIRCPANAACLPTASPIEFSLCLMDFPEPPALVMDNQRLDSNQIFFFYDDSATITGSWCEYGDCTITCDSTCSCLTAPDPAEGDDPRCSLGIIDEADPATSSCPIIEELPDNSIPFPEELVIYERSETGFRDPLKISCPNVLTGCAELYIGESQFLLQTGSFQLGDEVVEYSFCKEGPCYLACDPSCTCVESTNDVESECTVAASLPPTSAPVMLPSSAASCNGRNTAAYILAGALLFATLLFT